MKELGQIRSRKPTEEEWNQWRTRQAIEKDLIAEYKEAGINLIFNILHNGVWTFMPEFMYY